MRILTLLSILFLSLDINAQDTTFVHGTLIRFNYLSDSIDSSSVADWSIIESDSPGFKRLTTSYEEVIKIQDSTYLMKNYSAMVYGDNPFIFQTLVNAETKRDYPMGGYSISDVIMPFDITPWWLPVRDGLAYLCGESQQLFIGSDNFPNGTFREFNFENFGQYGNYTTFIIGKIGEKYTVAHADELNGEYSYFLCEIDDNLLVTPSDTLITDFSHSEDPDFVPKKIQTISESVFLLHDNSIWDNKSMIAVLDSDTLKVITSLDKYLCGKFSNNLYFLQDYQIVKQPIDTLTGVLSEKKVLDINNTNTIISFSDFSENIALWTSDSLKVYSLSEERIIYSIQVLRDTEEYITSELRWFYRDSPLIDDNYVYLHRIDTVTDLDDDTILPIKFSLAQNYPNPFNPNTTITYSIPISSDVEVKVFNAIGSEVRTIVNEYQAPGTYRINFDGNKLASGVYYYRIKAEGYLDVKKMLLLK